ncbi:FAD-dependent oxidoreductase [Actinomadura keratinilytica]
MEPFAGELVAESLRAAGADVRTGVSVTALARDASGVTLTLDDGSTLQADEVLFATGRAPAPATSASTRWASPPATGSPSTTP